MRSRTRSWSRIFYLRLRNHGFQDIFLYGPTALVLVLIVSPLRYHGHGVSDYHTCFYVILITNSALYG